MQCCWCGGWAGGWASAALLSQGQERGTQASCRPPRHERRILAGNEREDAKRSEQEGREAARHFNGSRSDSRSPRSTTGALASSMPNVVPGARRVRTRHSGGERQVASCVLCAHLRKGRGDTRRDEDAEASCGALSPPQGTSAQAPMAMNAIPTPIRSTLPPSRGSSCRTRRQVHGWRASRRGCHKMAGPAKARDEASKGAASCRPFPRGGDKKRFVNVCAGSIRTQ